MQVFFRLIIPWAVMIAAGCQTKSVNSDATSNAATSIPGTPRSSESPASSSQGVVTPMPTATAPTDPILERIIHLAKEDLAQRLSISTDQIHVMEAYAVEWTDSSLGCPQPELMYLPVITPGYLIRLQGLDKVFEFHTTKGDQIIYCDNPSAPLPGALPDR